MTRGALPPRVTVALAAAAAAVGCTVGPSYHQPDMAVPARWTESAPAVSSTASEAALTTWWTQFDDPTLSRLIGEALAGNLDLATAVSRVREARLQEAAARAREYPSLNATADALTFNSNRGGASAPAGATGGPPAGGLPIPAHFNFYSAGFDATWEVDLFGATRRAVEAAKANAAAALWARRDGEVSLTAEVAAHYMSLRALQGRIALGHAELQRQRGLFDLIRARRQAGFVTNLDVNQQTGLVETAAAQIPQLQAQADGEIHALAVLVGKAPADVGAGLRAVDAQPAPPPMLPPGLPSDLLRRRPDVREAERRLAASNAEIGVEGASLYPQLNLIGLASFASPALGNLFASQNLGSAAIGMATQPIFDAGRRRALVGAAKEEATQARLAYFNAVLGAIRDVEDALGRIGADQARRASLTRAVAAARSSETIAEDQYRTGLVTFVNVLQAQFALLNAEDQLLQANGQAQNDIVSLYKALGGGWST